MPSPATTEAFLEVVRQSGVVSQSRLDACLAQLDGSSPPESPRKLADLLVKEAVLTNYQAALLLKGKWDTFRIGPYRILERLGFGAMSNVYLCKHQGSRERVAVKVLSQAKAKNPTDLKRFFREARAAASLDHPNIVRVRDVDWDNESNYIVMDYIDGSSLQDIVKEFGPVDPQRAAHYIHQAAEGLQHAHKLGLVHRDIKPGNLLLDREGTVKILDMGLARFVEEEEVILTAGEMLGSPEYISPEQIKDSHEVDIRTDIYSLGAVFYYLLTGVPPYNEEKSAAGKLLSKEIRPPKPIRDFSPNVPEELVAIVNKMMAKDADDRYETPAEVADDLEPHVETRIGPPPEREMPQLSPAARATDTESEPGPASFRRVDQESTVPAWVQVMLILILGIAAFMLAWVFLKK